MQLGNYETESLENDSPIKRLTPRSYYEENLSEGESEAAINSILQSIYDPIIPELEMSINKIKANSKAKSQFKEDQKKRLKKKLIEKLNRDIIITNPTSKEYNSVNTASTSNGLENIVRKDEESDDSLVNLDIETKKQGSTKDW